MNIALCVFAYLFGGIPWGYLLFYMSEKKDIRKHGSHSTGATNVFRLKGWKLALPVMLADIFKGFFPVFLASKLSSSEILPILCGFLAVVGHCFPVYINLRGGKGVGTTLGVFLAVHPLSALIFLTVFFTVLAASRIVSLASLCGSFSLIPSSYFLIGNETVFLGVALFFLIVIRHLGNIKRLISGNERRLGQRYQ
jgi:glycerol-3-phosphate acyltransferase PlsY